MKHSGGYGKAGNLFVSLKVIMLFRPLSTDLNAGSYFDKRIAYLPRESSLALIGDMTNARLMPYKLKELGWISFSFHGASLYSLWNVHTVWCSLVFVLPRVFFHMIYSYDSMRFRVDHLHWAYGMIAKWICKNLEEYGWSLRWCRNIAGNFGLSTKAFNYPLHLIVEIIQRCGYVLSCIKILSTLGLLPGYWIQTKYGTAGLSGNKISIFFRIA